MKEIYNYIANNFEPVAVGLAMGLFIAFAFNCAENIIVKIALILTKP